MTDEFILDTPAVRRFIEGVRAELASAAPAEALAKLRPAFAALLADPDWLPAAYRAPAGSGGMGGGVASWLLYRGGDGSLSVSIHLLGNDTGCTWRHAYTPEDGGVRPFRSGWTNVPCRDEGKKRAPSHAPVRPGDGPEPRRLRRAAPPPLVADGSGLHT